MLPTDSADRKAIPIYSGFVKYFPLAMAEVAKVSKAGNDQHNPGMELFWNRAKSGDELDALMRHAVDGTLGLYDEDGQLHAAKLAWRAMANLEKLLERLAWTADVGDVVGVQAEPEQAPTIIRDPDGSDSGHREPLESCPICSGADDEEDVRPIWEVEGEGEPEPQPVAPPPNVRMEVTCGDPDCIFCGENRHTAAEIKEADEYDTDVCSDKTCWCRS